MSGRQILSKVTVQAGLASLVLVTTSYLAITDRIDGPTFFGLALLVAGFYFGNKNATNSKTE